MAWRIFPLARVDNRFVEIPFVSVPRHIRINAGGPRIDPASHGEGVFNTDLAEKSGGSEGAHAVVAVDDDSAFGVLLEGFDAIGEFAQWNQVGAIKMAEVPLVRLAAVDQSRALVFR
jgi:hypothetical protein